MKIFGNRIVQIGALVIVLGAIIFFAARGYSARGSENSAPALTAQTVMVFPDGTRSLSDQQTLKVSEVKANSGNPAMAQTSSWTTEMAPVTAYAATHAALVDTYNTNLATAFLGYDPPTIKGDQTMFSIVANAQGVITTAPTFPDTDLNYTMSFTDPDPSNGMNILGVTGQRLLITYVRSCLNADFSFTITVWNQILSGESRTSGGFRLIDAAYSRAASVDGKDDYIGTVAVTCNDSMAYSKADYLLQVISQNTAEPILAYRVLNGDLVTLYLTKDPNAKAVATQTK